MLCSTFCSGDRVTKLVIVLIAVIVVIVIIVIIVDSYGYHIMS